MLRREVLCPAPRQCPDVQMLDPYAGPDALPCEECPIVALDRYLRSPLGLRFQRVIELDFALRAGFTIGLEDVNIIDFRLLQLLDDERRRYEQEEIEKSRNKNARH
jgi:hypothetical protein